MSVKFEVCSLTILMLLAFNPQLLGVTWPWPRPLFVKKFFGGHDRIVPEKCVSNLKSVALTILKLLAFNPQNLGLMSPWPRPLIEKKTWGSCPCCPW